MKLFVGLGNPGTKYAKNRHNVGFRVVDAIADSHNFGPWRKRFQGHVSEGRLASEKCLLLKPATYMNESGRSVSEASRYHKLGLEDIIVFHDEIDLAPAKLRIKVGGGVAGHNGLRSITSHIGNDYMRVRIGVGHPGHKDLVHKYVLSDFAKADAPWLAPLIDAIAEAAVRLADDDTANFMNDVARVNRHGRERDNTETKSTNDSRRTPAVKGLSASNRGGDNKQTFRSPTQTKLARTTAERRAPPGAGKWDMVSRSETEDEQSLEATKHVTGSHSRQQNAFSEKLKNWFKRRTSS